MTGRLPTSTDPVVIADRLVRTHLAAFQHAVLVDAVREAVPIHWLRRAKAFDRVGTPGCDEIATACRNRAQLGIDRGDAAALAALALDEVA